MKKDMIINNPIPITDSRLSPSSMGIVIKLTKNTLANYFIWGWSFIVSFILFPFIVNHIGIAETGLWVLVSSITGYFALGQLGLGTSTTKFVAQCQAEKDEEKTNKFINTTFFILFGIGIVTTVGLVIVGHFFIPLFNIPQELIHKAQIATYIAAIGMFFSLPMETFRSVIRGFQRYELLALIAFCISILEISLTLYFISHGYGLVTLVLINCTTGILGGVSGLLCVKKLFSHFHIKFKNLEKTIAKSLFSLGILTFIIDISTILTYPTVNVMIGTFLTVGALTYYAACFKLYRLIFKLSSVFSFATAPLASEMDAKRAVDSLRNLFIKGTKYLTAFSLSLGVPVIMFSKQILLFWLGEDFALYYLISIILLVSSFFSCSHFIALQILRGMNKLKLASSYYILVALLTILSGFILIPRIGILGAALAIALPQSILEPFFLFYTLKVFKLKLHTYIKEVLLKTYPQAGAIAIGLFILIHNFRLCNLSMVALFLVASLVTYWLLFYIFGLNKDGKNQQIQVLKYVFLRYFGRRKVGLRIT